MSLFLKLAKLERLAEIQRIPACAERYLGLCLAACVGGLEEKCQQRVRQSNQQEHRILQFVHGTKQAAGKEHRDSSAG